MHNLEGRIKEEGSLRLVTSLTSVESPDNIIIIIIVEGLRFGAVFSAVWPFLRTAVA